MMAAHAAERAALQKIISDLQEARVADGRAATAALLSVAEKTNQNVDKLSTLYEQIAASAGRR